MMGWTQPSTTHVMVRASVRALIPAPTLAAQPCHNATSPASAWRASASTPFVQTDGPVMTATPCPTLTSVFVAFVPANSPATAPASHGRTRLAACLLACMYVCVRVRACVFASKSHVKHPRASHLRFPNSLSDPTSRLVWWRRPRMVSAVRSLPTAGPLVLLPSKPSTHKRWFFFLCTLLP